jgi:hypothetical protein
VHPVGTYYTEMMMMITTTAVQQQRRQQQIGKDAEGTDHYQISDATPGLH